MDWVYFYTLFHSQNVLIIWLLYCVCVPGGDQEETQDDHNGVCPAGEWTPLHCRRLSLEITDEPRHWNPVTVRHHTHHHPSLNYASLKWQYSSTLTRPVELLASFARVLLVQLVDVRVGLNALTDSRANIVYLSRCIVAMALGKKKSPLTWLDNIWTTSKYKCMLLWPHKPLHTFGFVLKCRNLRIPAPVSFFCLCLKYLKGTTNTCVFIAFI